jgi:AcrR family transcriptional regulator
MPVTPTTREQLLDAAIELLATDGMRAVTHRAVEQRAGASHGSTTYHFGSRTALLGELLRHVAEHDERAIREVLGSVEPPTDVSEPELAAMIASVLSVVAVDRTYALARYELFLYAARHSEFQPEVVRWRGLFVTGIEPLMRAGGATDPPRSARWFVAALDGILLDQLVNPDPDFAAQAIGAFAGLLRAAISLAPGGGFSR